MFSDNSLEYNLGSSNPEVVKAAQQALQQKRQLDQYTFATPDTKNFTISRPHSSHDELRERQEQPLIDLPLNSVWRHYKGGLYKISGFVMRESTEDIEVCYFDFEDPLPYPWCRPVAEWIGLVNHEGKFKRRYIRDDAMGIVIGLDIR